MIRNPRLEEKETEINKEIKELNEQVNKFKNVAWGFVTLGFIVIIVGLIFGNFKTFSEFGDFIGGSVGSIWSLAGLFFVYIAFLGQKQSILNQQIEILYNQEELRATRKELAGQKEQMELQNATLKQQQFENTFFKMLEYYNSFLEKNYISNFWCDFFRTNPQFKNYKDYFDWKIKRKNKHLAIDDFVYFIDSVLRHIEKNCLQNNQFYADLFLKQTDIDSLYIYYLESRRNNNSFYIEKYFKVEKFSEIKILKSKYDPNFI